MTMFIVSSPYSQQLVFPTAEGYGKFANGGRGGAVYEVTNLGTVKEVVFRSVNLSNNIHNPARSKLRMINNAGTINDLRIPPANRLEKLKGDLKGLHSIRINDQWRITFKWRESHAFEVKIVDYHD